MSFIYITSSPDNLGGISAVAEQLKEDIKLNKGTVLYNGYGARSYMFDCLVFLKSLRSHQLIVINTPLLRRALLRDLFFLFTARLFNRKVHLCFHGGNLEFSEATIDKLLVGIYKLLSSKYLYLGKSLIPSDDKGDKCGTFINPIISNRYCSTYRYSEEKIRFLFLARLVPEKGVLVAIDILKEVSKILSYQKIEYLIAGTGPVSNLLSSYVEGNLTVDYLGRVEGDEKLKLLAKSDFLILPSTFPEGMPMSILESTVSRTVVLTTDVGAISDYIESEVTGYVFDGDRVDINAWAEKIADLIKQGSELKQVRNKAYEVFSNINNQDVIDSFL